LEGASGRVSLLIGQDNLRLFPVETRRSGGMALFKSQFGTGWIASGNAGTLEPATREEDEIGNDVLVLVAQENKHFQTPEFLSAEAMGVDLPRRCPSCKNCKECQFRTSAVSYKEDQEYHVILEGLKFNEGRRKWTASYPFFIPPSELRDNYQQVKTYTERMEKRLIKQGRVDEFNSQFKDTVNRDVSKELSKEELEGWKGPFNYIAMVEAFKNGSHATTPLRICMNSSLKQLPPIRKSLNYCLMKGPPALVDLFTVTLSFREHRYALTKDLSKFYQRVEADNLAQHMRRILWRDCDDWKELRVYVTTTVNFGDRPAGCIAIAAMRETAQRYGGDLPEAAWFLKYRTYVDDAVAGANSLDRLKELSAELEMVAARGSFQFKETLMSGDATADSSEPRKVLGLVWETREDKLQVDVKLNTGGKVGGARVQEDIDLEGDLGKAVPGAITKRILWRVAQGQYDPLGLLCAFTIRFKIIMRSLSDEEEGVRVGWDDPVPASVESDFREVLEHLKDLKRVDFPRSIWPEPGRGPVKGNPMLLVFGNGSVEASCALAYLRWELDDGSVVCRLLAGKTRVAPKCKVSIPRMELMGSLVAVRLYQKINDSLRLEVSEARFFTDSSAVLGMIFKDSGTFLEFVGTRVSEIQTKSKVDTEWFWIPGELNPADMGTRPTMTPRDMGEGTPYQVGLSWMYQPVDSWPTRKDFTSPPAEECRKDVTQATCAVARIVKRGLAYPARATSRAKLVRIFGYVMMAAAAFRKRPRRTPLVMVEAGEGRKVPGPPPRCYLEAALDYLVEDAQKNMNLDGTASLEAEEIIREHDVCPPRRIKVVMARGERYLKVAYNAEALPILPYNHPLSRLILGEAHAVDHGGIEPMTMRSRSHAWIVRIKKLAKSIKRNCFACKRRAKARETQKMAPLPEHRVGPAPVFESTGVDLFGPITFQDTRQQAGEWKGMGSGVCVHCHVTGARRDH
jgi:hypothetical protein